MAATPFASPPHHFGKVRSVPEGLVTVHAVVLALLLLFFSDTTTAASMVLPAVPDDVATTYAQVQWPNPSYPRFVNLGADHYLLATIKGMQLWNAKENRFSEVKGWPLYVDLERAWARLGEGTLLVAGDEDEKGVPLVSLFWWNAKNRALSTPLPLRQGQRIYDLVPIDTNHALVCMQSPNEPDKSLAPPSFSARLVFLHDGVLSWETENSDQLRAAILAAGVRGEVEGIGRVADEPPPVFFNADTCQWQMKTLPDFMREGSHLTIKHYRLPDGRLLIGHAEWVNPASHTRTRLAAPLLWNQTEGRWDTIDNTAQEGDDGGHFQSFGIDGPVVSMYAGYIEFLDPVSLRWIRSRKKLPGNAYYTNIAPLSTGQVLVFVRERGRVLLLDPMREAVPGRFTYDHARWGEVKLQGGGLFFGSGGDEWHPNNRPEILKPPALLPQSIIPMPEQLGFLSGVELPDTTILMFGGLPPRCGPDGNYGDHCKKSAQPSYRYFPQENRWERVPDLAVHFAQGQSWESYDGYPRNDTLLQKNGDFVFLDSGNAFELEDGNAPITTTLTRWRIGGAAQPLAPLRQGRTQATLLELADGRLVVIGGRAQQSIIDKKNACTDCPNKKVSGPLEFESTTEIYDDKANQWLPGPIPNHAGGRAVKLANGRIFKLSMKGLGADEGYRAEVADAAFAGWEELPDFPLQPFNVRDVVTAENRVLILPGKPSQQTVIWDDARRAWLVSELWYRGEPLAITPLDSKRALVRSSDSFEIVPMPQGQALAKSRRVATPATR